MFFLQKGYLQKGKTPCKYNQFPSLHITDFSSYFHSSLSKYLRYDIIVPDSYLLWQPALEDKNVEDWSNPLLIDS